jgi:hypothetical protein
MVKQMVAILIICFVQEMLCGQPIDSVIIHDSLNAIKSKKPDASHYYLRTGYCYQSGNESNGVHLFSEIKKEYQYHVFSPEGVELFSSTHFKKEHPMGCDEEEKRTSWLLVPDTNFVDFNLDSFGELFLGLVVAGTAEKCFFHAPVISKVSNFQKKICMKALLKFESYDSTDFEHIQFYSAGTKENVHRLFVELTTKGYFSDNMIAVVDIIGNKAKVLFKKNKCSNEVLQYFLGQADLDQDGFCDTFTLNFGDIGGKWILSYLNGKWKLWMDIGAAPC